MLEYLNNVFNFRSIKYILKSAMKMSLQSRSLIIVIPAIPKISFAAKQRGNKNISYKQKFIQPSNPHSAVFVLYLQWDRR